METAAIFAILFGLLAIGLPVAFSLLVSGAIGLWMMAGPVMMHGILTTAPLSSIQLYAFIAIPMFILMANFVFLSGISDELFDIARKWMGRTPGGLAHATALTGAAFGAISGSSTAAAATLSSTSIPGMLKLGYDMKLATGVAAISGTLAMLIPPSVAMILYAIIADLSVSQLLIAGVVPGILVTLTIMLTVLYLVWRNPHHAPHGQAYSIGEKIRSLRSAWSVILLFGLVIGSIYGGVATPTESSAIGALGAAVICLTRGVKFRHLSKAAVQAIEASCMIALIVICAHVFGYFISVSRVTDHIIGFIVEAELNRYMVLFFVVVLYLILGCFMDLITILIVTVPTVAPLMMELGFDPIWFAVITIVTAEVGMVTPPLGLNVFVISRYTRIPAMEVFRGTYPHVVAHVILIAVLCAFPALSTWLPATMAN